MHLLVRFITSSVNFLFQVHEVSRRMIWAGHVARMGERGDVLVGKPMEKSPLWRPRSRWKDNIKIDL
jgi:hypothetical protein